MKKTFLFAAVAAAMFAGGVLTHQLWQPPARTIPAGEAIGGAFSLLDGGGKVVTDSDFAGQPYALLFGFTHCPDVCPTSLFQMRGWITKLGARAKEMRFAFATVDPLRDPPPVLGEYVAAFSPDIIALSGGEEDIRRLVDAHKIYTQKTPLAGGYTMDHFPSVFLFDAEGRFVEFIHYREKQDSALQKLNRLLDG